jgi:spore maturation protein CgeB
VNIPTRYGHPDAYDLNMRVFEVPITMTPLVTNWSPVLTELGFVHGYNCYTYRSADELCQVVHYLKQNPHKAGLAGYDGTMLILERHLYSHRAKQVLEWLQ